MSAFDYAEVQALALELITDFGRVCTVGKFATTSATPTKPWEGSGAPTAQAIAESHELPMVFVDPASARSLGLDSIGEDLLKRVGTIALVAPGVGFTADLLKYQVVVDENLRWIVEWTSRLKPGPEVVLYFLGLKR